MLNKLVILADRLDKIGLHKDASMVDGIIQRFAAEKEYTFSISYSYATPEDVEAGTSGSVGFLFEDKNSSLKDIVRTAKNLTYNWDKSHSAHGGYAGTAGSDDMDPGEKWSHKSYLLVIENSDKEAEDYIQKNLL